MSCVLTSNVTLSKLSRPTISSSMLTLESCAPSVGWTVLKDIGRSSRHLYSLNWPYSSGWQVLFFWEISTKLCVNRSAMSMCPSSPKRGSRLNNTWHPHGISDKAVHGLNRPSILFGRYLTLLLDDNICVSVLILKLLMSLPLFLGLPIFLYFTRCCPVSGVWLNLHCTVSVLFRSVRSVFIRVAVE
jgi:hypothetical protein